MQIKVILISKTLFFPVFISITACYYQSSCTPGDREVKSKYYVFEFFS
jgi:hypothetical protein